MCFKLKIEEWRGCRSCFVSNLRDMSQVRGLAEENDIICYSVVCMSWIRPDVKNRVQVRIRKKKGRRRES